MDYKDRTFAIDVKATIWIDSECEREDYVHRICLTLSNGPLNVSGYVWLKICYVSDLYASCCTISPHAQELTWFLCRNPSSEFRSHWLLGLHDNHRAEVKLMLTFLDLSFWHDQLLQHLLQSGHTVLTGISELAQRLEIGLLLPVNKLNSVLVGTWWTMSIVTWWYWGD